MLDDLSVMGGRTLAGKTVFVTGASRGIGEAIAVRAARDGARVVIAAKTTEPHPRLPGTIYTAAEKVEAAGGRALPVACDLRFHEQITAAVDRAVAAFGGIDILVNNASAISLTGTLDTPTKRYDLMHQVNARATFLCSQACIPYLARAENPHILDIAPPLAMLPKWFGPHVAYTMSKYGMSMCVLGMTEELRTAGIAVNALWPRTTIATAAVRNLMGGDTMIARSRKPEIMADAAWVILVQDSRDFTGRFLIDEDVLRSTGMTDFAAYAVDPRHETATDLFVDP